MSSIPLPALQIHPVESSPDLVGNYGRILQLRDYLQNAPLQRQALQQQVQAGALENQTKQLQLQDQQAMTAAMHQWAQPVQGSSTTGTSGASAAPNYDDLIDLAKKNGASFNAIKGLQDYVMSMKEKASTIAKDDAQTGNDNANAMKTKNGMLIDAMSGVMNLPDDQLAPGLLSAAQQLGQKGLLDPQHVQIAQQLAQSGDPAAIRKQLNLQITGLGGFNKLLEDAQKKAELQQTQGKSDPNSIFYAPSEAAIAAGVAPGAAQIQAGRTTQAARTAGAEAAARQPYELSLARARQAIQDGDPRSAAQLLINGDVAPSQIISSRKPEFAQQAFQAAHDLSGGTWNAQSAEANFKVAGSPSNIGFFGSAKSLTDKGGTLDQLATAAKDIPQGQIPALNGVADWMQAASGSGPIAKYASIALGVADDYSKVMNNGTGSEKSRDQALNLVKPNQSPAQRAASIEGIRGSVGSQMTSRIGDNPVLKRMYGGNGSGGGSQQGGGYKLTASGPQGHKIGSNDGGQTWFDVQTGQAVK